MKIDPSEPLKTFDEYFLLEKLAVGGMAEVHLAYPKKAVKGIGKLFALKTIHNKYASNKELSGEAQNLKEMFEDEARMATKLSHNNIVSIYKFGEFKGNLYLVMEFIEGRNLRQITRKLSSKKQSLSLPAILYLVKEIANGLDYAHKFKYHTEDVRRVIHRDISPQNIMISFQGSVKIVDFGIAKALGVTEETEAGTLKGKFSYMSPEQSKGSPLDHRTDIFSLGIVLWELLTGKRLFHGSNERESLKKIQNLEIPKLSAYNPNISSYVQRIVSKALERDPDNRYQTAKAMYKDLSEFMNRSYPIFNESEIAKDLSKIFYGEIEEFSERYKLHMKRIYHHIEENTEAHTDLNTDDIEEFFVEGDLSERTNKFSIGENTFAEEDRKIAKLEKPSRKVILELDTDREYLKDPIAKVEDAIKHKEKGDRTHSKRDRDSLKEVLRDSYAEKIIDLDRSLLQEHRKTNYEKLAKEFEKKHVRGYDRRKILAEKSTTKSIAKIFINKTLFFLGYSFLFFYTGFLFYFLFVYKFSIPEDRKVKRIAYEFVKSIPHLDKIKYTKNVLYYLNPDPTDHNSSSDKTSKLKEDKENTKIFTSVENQKPIPKSFIFRTNPSGASIYIDNKYRGITPRKLFFNPKKEFRLELKKSGYINYKGTFTTKSEEQEGLKKNYSIDIKLIKASYSTIYLDIRPIQEVNIFINNRKMPPPTGQQWKFSYKVPMNHVVQIRIENKQGKKRLIKLNTGSKKVHSLKVNF